MLIVRSRSQQKGKKKEEVEEEASIEFELGDQNQGDIVIHSLIGGRLISARTTNWTWYFCTDRRDAVTPWRPTIEIRVYAYY